MSEPMTLQEAVDAISNVVNMQYDCVPGSVGEAERVLLAHTERTLAAREGEPHVLRELRDDMRLDQERLWASSHLDTLVAHIDALTAQLAEARRERDGYEQEIVATAEALRWPFDDEDDKPLRERAAERMRESREFEAERDTLAAIVERVRGVPRYTIDQQIDGSMEDRLVLRGPYFRAADILAALTSPAGMHSAPAQPATEADRP